MAEKEYESIVQRILKLQKLAEQGVGGEAENARAAIENIVRRYGLSLDEILSDNKKERHIWRVKTAREKHLFIQCLGVVTESWQPATLERGMLIGAELTKFEFAELSAMFDFHRANMEHEYKEMISSFEAAYFSKHQIFPATGIEDHQGSDMSIEKAKRILAMMKGMEDKSYRKQLTE